MKNKLKYILIFLSIFLLGAAFGLIEFDRIKIRQNPAITLPKGDVISNDTAGTIKMNTSKIKIKSLALLNYDSITNTQAGRIDFGNADIYAKRLVPTNNAYPSNTYFVSPNYTNDASLHNYSTISGALAAMSSGTIYVFEGTYNEKLTGKANVTIIGAGSSKTIITSGDSSTVYLNGITNFVLMEMTIENSSNQSSSKCIGVYECYTTTSPNIVFSNVVVRRTEEANGISNAIYCDSASIALFNSFIHVTAAGTAGTQLLFLANHSNPVIDFCKFKIPGGSANDNSIFLNDNTVDLTIGHSQNECGGEFIYVSGGSPTSGRSYRNFSNVSDLDFTNLITTHDNIVDANFIVR